MDGEPAEPDGRLVARTTAAAGALADHPDQLGHKLRLCAAAPMPPDTDKAWQERFHCKTFSGGYGGRLCGGVEREARCQRGDGEKSVFHVNQVLLESLEGSRAA